MICEKKLDRITGIKNFDMTAERVFRRERTSLDPVRCPICGKMAFNAYGSGGRPAFKHTGIRRETTYCYEKEAR
jgi:hypothetical protein